jgi:hypothetical protein
MSVVSLLPRRCKSAAHRFSAAVNKTVYVYRLATCKAVNKPASLWYLLYVIDAVLEEQPTRSGHFLDACSLSHTETLCVAVLCVGGSAFIQPSETI